MKKKISLISDRSYKLENRKPKKIYGFLFKEYFNKINTI